MLDLAALFRLLLHPAPLHTLEGQYTAPIGAWTW
jgi:hypothetical protein